ncbi:MAG: hypothetical protein V9F00_17415 [Nocardioides sp.]
MVPQMRTVAGDTGDIDVALADREDLTDPCRCAEHDLDDLLQLAVRRRAGEARTTTPAASSDSDHLNLLERERLRLRRRLVQPGGVTHGVLGDGVVPHRQPERRG